MPYTAQGTGWQHTDTSLDSALKVQPRAAILRKRVLEAFHRSVFGLTSDEAALEIGESILSVRPRVTELRRDGLLVDSGIRRANASGHRAAVLTIKTGGMNGLVV